MADLRERKKQATRRRIAEEALQLFSEHGYATTTTERIAAAANVSPRTVFRYFPAKSDLVFHHEQAWIGSSPGASCGRHVAPSPSE